MRTSPISRCPNAVSKDRYLLVARVENLDSVLDQREAEEEMTARRKGGISGGRESGRAGGRAASPDQVARRGVIVATRRSRSCGSDVLRHP